MPEISIGLYPDVGGSWFLRRMPGRVGPVPRAHGGAAQCGRCHLLRPGRPAGAARAQGAGAGGHRRRAHGRARPRPTAPRCRASCAQAGEGAELPPSKVREHFDTINALMAGDDLLDIAKRLRALQSDDAWLQTAAQDLRQGRAELGSAVASSCGSACPACRWPRCSGSNTGPRSASARTRISPRASARVLIDKDRNPQLEPGDAGRDHAATSSKTTCACAATGAASARGARSEPNHHKTTETHT